MLYLCVKMLAYLAFHEKAVLQQDMTIMAYPCNNALCLTPEHLFLCEKTDKRGKQKQDLSNLKDEGRESIRRSQVSSLLSLLSLSLYSISLSILSLYLYSLFSILYSLFSLIISYYLLFSLYSISMLASHRLFLFLFFSSSLLQMDLARKAMEREDAELTIGALTASTSIAEYTRTNEEQRKAFAKTVFNPVRDRQ